ncbi:hypothetical protein [Lactococcus formosensis]|uniref:hypothetical protein n=1 Tax=Lactococcus formosensis TaxID=1281486 RepID=UPI002434B935|nr:hypothetical protein [Lactococcus formosensis]MDG6113763.1 hypothetical protein [Lactococcus formosensis]MDG6122246.1 hypothetical protein [Lactococcus formosensis]MDG6151852.1 hypothetical protein [Lactococcus formosensis]MDG6174928.1 hypothetical protein [Lactococcus formosensis]MDG6181246.1 hypothetical protein [Lactococcus formosensis]
MDALYIVQLVFWIALLFVVIVLFIKNMREARKHKKKMIELDKQREEIPKNTISITENNIPSSIKEGLDQYRIIKAQTAYNGEKYFIEVFFQNTQTSVILKLSPYDTYERALDAKLFFEQSQIDDVANAIVTKEVVE